MIIRNNSRIANFKYFCIQNLKAVQRIFAKSTLKKFWESYPDSEQYLKTWYNTAMNSEWKTPNDVKKIRFIGTHKEYDNIDADIGTPESDEAKNITL
jgi:hypothetical protein